MRTQNPDRVFSLLENGTTRLETPKYIPEGYQLTESIVEFYITQAALDAELLTSYVKDGQTYATYHLPNGYQHNIYAVRLYYENEKGEFLRYNARLMDAISDTNNFGVGAPDTTTAETLSIEGYEKSVLLYDKAKLNGTLYSGYLYKSIPVHTAISPFALDPEWREMRSYEETLSAAIYTLEAEALSRNELLKVLNSIQ